MTQTATRTEQLFAPDDRPAPMPTIGRYPPVGDVERTAWGWRYGAVGAGEREVVVRVIDPERVNERTLGRFRQDSVQLRKIDHPGAARVLDAGRVTVPGGETVYLVEERVEGETLDAWVAGRPARDRARALAAVADALHGAHLKGVAHRDLRAESVVVERCGRVRVRGFGLASVSNLDVRCFSSASPETGARVACMAPEQAAGSLTAIDLRTDVYALGALAYATLTGRPPYRMEAGAKATGGTILNETPDPTGLRGPLGRSLDLIVRTALRKRREDRYQSASELAADLRRALGGEPLLVERAGGAGHAIAAVRRSPGAAGFAGGALAAMLAGAAALGFWAAPGESGSPTTPARTVSAPADGADENNTGANPALLAVSSPAQETHRMAVARMRRAAIAEMESGRRLSAIGTLRAAAALAGEDAKGVTAGCEMLIAEAYEGLGDAAAAEAALRRALADAEAAMRGGPDETTVRAALAENLARQGRFADAEAVAVEALARSIRARGADHPATRRAYDALRGALEADGRSGQAARWWESLADGRRAPSA